MRGLRQDVATMAEADLLAAIKRLAVKDESILVHRIKLNKMTQSPGVAEILRLIEIFICLLSFLIISADLNIFIYAFLIWKESVMI